jgi:hypothetical protein
MAKHYGSGSFNLEQICSIVRIVTSCCVSCIKPSTHKIDISFIIEKFISLICNDLDKAFWIC